MAYHPHQVGEVYALVFDPLHQRGLVAALDLLQDVACPGHGEAFHLQQPLPLLCAVFLPPGQFYFPA